jgi:hypothetical protein
LRSFLTCARRLAEHGNGVRIFIRTRFPVAENQTEEKLLSSIRAFEKKIGFIRVAEQENEGEFEHHSVNTDPWMTAEH